MWVTEGFDDRLVQVDPDTNRIVRRIRVGRGAGGVAGRLGAASG